MKKEHFKHLSVLQLLIEFLIFFTLLAVQTGLSYSATASRHVLHPTLDLSRFQANLVRAKDSFRLLPVQSASRIAFSSRGIDTQREK